MAVESRCRATPNRDWLRSRGFFKRPYCAKVVTNRLAVSGHMEAVVFKSGLMARRGPWLTLGLTYIGISNAWWVYRSLWTYWDLVSHHDPNSLHWPFLALGVLSGIAVIGVVGLWFLRKWGLLVYLACWAAAQGVNIILKLPFRAYLLSLANLLVLYLFLWPRRDRLE